MNAKPISAGGARATQPAATSASPKRLHTYGLLGRSAAEAVGSFLLVFAGAVTVFSGTGGISGALAIGLAVAAAMVGFGYVSGGHFNPALSLASAAAGRTSWKALPVYVIAQLAGAALAAVILWVVFQGHPDLMETREIFTALSNGYGTGYALEFPLASALLAEVVATALLTAVFLGATTGRRTAASAAFAVGVTYVVLLTILTPITGGSLNPARSTAFAIFAESGALGQLWLFWVAPVLGALIAGLIYRSIDLTVSDAAGADQDEADTDEEHAVDGGAPAAGTVAAAAGSSDNAGSGKAGSSVKSAASKDSADTTGRTADEDARGFFDTGDTDNGGTGNGRPGTPKA